MTDLHTTVAGLDERLERLRVQRDQALRLIGSVDEDGSLSPMPASVQCFYAQAEARAIDERARRVIRRERDFMELAFYRGEMPPEVELVYQGFDEAKWADSVALFERIGAREGTPTPAQIAEFRDAVTARIRRQLGPDLARLARSIDVDVARRAADLWVQLADERERALHRAVADAVVSLVEQER